MVKVIEINFVEINPGEVVEERTILHTFLWFIKVKETYRKVHGEYFIYNKGKYGVLGFQESNLIRSFFKLPLDE